jgi:hypothetical protein
VSKDDIYARAMGLYVKEHFGVVSKNFITPKPNAFGRLLAFKQLEGYSGLHSNKC